MKTNPNNVTSRHYCLSLLLGMSVAFSATLAQAQTFYSSWTQQNGGNWTTGSNWLNSTIPGYDSGSGAAIADPSHTASLILNFSANRTINVDSDVRLGVMNIGDITGGQSLTLNGGPIIMDNSLFGAQSLWNKIAGGGNDTINSDIVMADVGDSSDIGRGLLLNLNAGTTIFAGVISGDQQGLYRRGTSNMQLLGANTFSGRFTNATTGGTVQLGSTAGNSISSSELYLGTSSRDGNASSVLQLLASNQINDGAILYFDGGSGKNGFFRLNGFNETVAGISDYTREGVIEHAGGVDALSVLTVDASSDSFYNSYLRDSTGNANRTLGLTKKGDATLTLWGDRISYTGATNVQKGTLKLVNTTNFGSAGGTTFRTMTVAAGATIELGSVSNWNLNASTQGAGALTMSGTNEVTLLRPTGHSGPTNVLGGILTVGSINNNVDTGGTTSAIIGSSVININGGILKLLNRSDATGGAFSNRVDDSTPILLQSGGIDFVNNQGAQNYSETLGAVTIGQGSALIRSREAVTGQTATLTLNSLNGYMGGTSGNLMGVVITDQGTGYSSAPTVTVSGGGVTGATATATVSGGKVITVTVTPDFGYTSTPTLSFSGGGGGSNAAARVAIDLFTSSVVGCTVTNAGAAYSSPPAVAFSGGGGAGAAGVAVMTGIGSNLKVASITITNPGFGYTSPPSVSFSGGGGSGAAAFAGLVRQKGNVEFFGRDLGDNATNKIIVTNAPSLQNGIIGGWAVVQGGGGGIGVNFATIEAGNSVRSLQTYAKNVADAAYTSTQNVMISGAAGPTLSANRSINSLKIEDGTARTLTIGTSTTFGSSTFRTLTVDTGGIIAANGAHIIKNGGLTAGAGSAFQLQTWVGKANSQSLQINSRIADNGNNPVSVVKSGDGELRLYGANKYTGGTYVNQGILEINGNGSLGDNPVSFQSNYLALDGGTLQIPLPSLAGTTLEVVFGASGYSESSGFINSNNKGVSLGAKGGIFALSDNGLASDDPNFKSTKLYLTDNISGEGGIKVGGVGTTGSGGTLVIGGYNSFLGQIWQDSGTTELGGYNATNGDLLLDGGTLIITNQLRDNSYNGLNTTQALANHVNSAVMRSGQLLLGTPSYGEVNTADFYAVIGSLVNASGIDLKKAPAVGLDVKSRANATLVVAQEANTLYSGEITDLGNDFGKVLNFTKDGRGNLTLGASANSYHGVTSINGGVLTVTSLGNRGDDSSIGYGSLSGLGQNESASFLNIADGAALSYIGTNQSTMNRTFTIGVGPQGAALYANGPKIGSTLTMFQGLYQTAPNTNVDDKIGFSVADQAATLIIGGNNLGENRFGQTLADNGTGALSLQKTGTGLWILGRSQVGASPNSYSGRTTIFSGTVAVENDHAFGAAGGDPVQLLGGNLDLRGVNYTTLEDLSIAGGKVRVLEGTGNSSWAGKVRLDSNATVEVGRGGFLQITGAISGSGALRKEGFGTLVISGANTYLGSTTVAEGALRVDYSDENANKLANASSIVLGGGREGGTLDVFGGTTHMTDAVNGLTLGLGQNRIIRSGGGDTQLSVNNISVQLGGTLDIASAGLASTSLPNDPTGILGSWATLGKSDWAKVGVSGTSNKPIVAYTGYTNNLWTGLTSNTDVLSDNTQTDATTSTLRFNQNASLTLTLVGQNILAAGGVLQTANVHANSNIIKGGFISGNNSATTSGFLTFHQFDAEGALRVDSVISNAPDAGDFVVNYSISTSGSTNLDFTVGTGPSATNFYAGMPVTGPLIPPGATITGISTSGGLVTRFVINREATAAVTNQTIHIGSFNGLLKTGEGTLFLNADNTYSGPTYITGGALSVRKLNNGTPLATTTDPNPVIVPGGLGSSNGAAANLRIGGATLRYVGDNDVVDRGFTINDIGAISVANEAVTLGFTGNLSGGGGVGDGTLQKLGSGTLSIIRKAVQTGYNGAGTPVFTSTGGATNFGEFQVSGGTLKLQFDDANVNNGGNNFASTAASLTLKGGRFVLEGVAGSAPPDPLLGGTALANFSEDRTQTLTGPLSLGSGPNEIRVIGKVGSKTTLNLQDPAVPTEVIRSAGATLHFVLDDIGSETQISLALPAISQTSVLTWATFEQKSKFEGVNNFAATVSSTSVADVVVSADSNALYSTNSNVASWSAGKVISEDGGTGFYGTTPTALLPGYDPAANPDSISDIAALRFYSQKAGTVNVFDSLNIAGGGILVAQNIGNNKKRILGGSITSSGYPDTLADNTDLMIHNYNPANNFEITSNIIDGNRINGDGSISYDTIKLNLVHVGTGTTELSGANTYTGTTFVSGGTLKLASVNAIPGGIAAVGGTSHININTGIIGLANNNFLRGLGFGADQVEFSGSGGFAAYGGTRDVNFGGAGATANWNSGGFVPSGGTFVLGQENATGMLRVINGINLGGTERIIRVANGAAAEDAVILGDLTGNGGELTKTGAGVLRLSGIGSYTDGTTIAAGTLIAHASALGSGPIRIGTSDSSKGGDAPKLILLGGSASGSITVGDKTGTGNSEMLLDGNVTLAGDTKLDHSLFVGSSSNKQLSLTGVVSGSGGFTILDGVTLALSAANNFGSSANAAGTGIDGSIIIRNGTVTAGNSTSLGDSTKAIELGDTYRDLGKVKRSSNNLSILIDGGDFDPGTNGVPGSINGTGGFVFANQSSVLIDGLAVGAAQATAGDKYLINGEADHPERNGIYKAVFTPAASNSFSKDFIILVRVSTFDAVTTMTYGSRVEVETGSEAGKRYFLASHVSTVNTSPVLWRLDSVDSNVGLQIAASGVTIDNNIDLNSTNGLGSTSLGGSSLLSSGVSIFNGNIVLTNQVPVVGSNKGIETRTLQLTSETRTGRGIVFAGTFSEANVNDVLSLNKTGSGAVTLLGNNTFKGSTDVNGGSLFVSNTVGSATGTGKVTVNNTGSLLGGNGRINGETTLNTGTILAAGDPSVDGGIGTLTFGGKLTLMGAAEMVFHLASDTSYDKVQTSGLLSLDAAAIIRVFLDFVPAGELEFDLLDWGSKVFAATVVDQLDLPTLLTDELFWDTSAFVSQGKVKLTASDGQPPQVRFAASGARIREGQTSVNVAVQLSRSDASIVTVPIAVSGSASLGLDYNLSFTPLTFAPGETAKTVTVSIIDDVITESPENILLSIGTPSGAIKTAPSLFAVILEDDDNGSPIGDNWTVRNPLPTNENLNDVAFSGTLFAAVGSRNTILTSTNGVAWTSAFVGLSPSKTLNAILWTGDEFVAIGNAGLVVTSSDGIVWTIRASPGQDMYSLVVRDNGGGNKLILAVGKGGSIYSSLNRGLTWSRRVSNTTVDLTGIVDAGASFIAVGKAGTVVTSTDGALWSVGSVGTTDDLNGLAWKGDLAVAVGVGGVAFTSDTGSTWTSRTSGTSNDLRAVNWDGTYFVASGAAGTVRHSTDGIAWSTSTLPVISHSLMRSTRGGAVSVMVGDAGTLLSSANGTTWSNSSTGDSSSLSGVAWNNSEYFAVGAGGTILHSSAGITWAKVVSVPSATDLNDIATAASGTQLVAVGETGTIWESANGSTWTAQTTGVPTGLNAIAKGSSSWIVVGDAGVVLTSTNGTTWTAGVSGSGADLLGVTTNGSMAVAVGSSGTILYSSNSGSTWSAALSPVSSALRSVHFDGSLFIAVGGDHTEVTPADGAILTSVDGTSWTKVSSMAFSALAGIAHSSEVVGSTTLLTRIAVGTGGTILGSTTGNAWSTKASNTNQNLSAIAWHNTTLVAVGANGTILTSERVANPPAVVSFEYSSLTGNENALALSPVAVVVHLTSPPPGKVTVPFVVSGNATKSKDYLITASPLVFDASKGETSKTIYINVKDDGLLEPTDETVTVTLGTPVNAPPVTKPATPPIVVSLVGAPFTLTIHDTDSLPTISLNTLSQFVPLSSSLSFSATVTGEGAPLVQWKKAGKVVANAVGTPFTIPTISIADAGKWTASATNLSGTTTTVAAAEIAVVDTFSHILPVKLGTTGIVPVIAGGNNLLFKWKKGSAEFSGDAGDWTATQTAKLAIKTFDGTEEDFYSCIVYRGAPFNDQLESGSIHVVVAAVPVIYPLGLPSSNLLPKGRVGAIYESGTGGYQIPVDVTDVHKTPTLYSAKGLPKGLTLNPLTGLISGRPTVAGTSNVIITATNPAGSPTPVTLQLVIDPVNPNALGSYVALLERDATVNQNLGGRVDITSTKDGAFSGKLLVGKTAGAFKGLLNTATDALPHGTALIVAKGKPTLTIDFDLDATGNLVSGTVSADGGITTVNFDGWRNKWDAKVAPATQVDGTPRAALYNVAANKPDALIGDATIPQGSSFFSVKLVAAGVATVAGKSADGNVVATAAPLGPDGQVLIYTPLYTNAGSFIGTATIKSSIGSPAHAVTGTGSWRKTATPTAKVNSYKAGFDAFALTFNGGKYVPALAPSIVLSIDPGSAASLNSYVRFDYGGIGDQLVDLTNSDTDPDINIHVDAPGKLAKLVTNPNAFALTIDAAKGTFKGSVNIKDGATVRKLSYEGLLIPDASTTGDDLDGIGQGFFNLPQLPQLVGETLKNTRILSGDVRFTEN